MAKTSRVSANLHVQQWIYYIMLRGFYKNMKEKATETGLVSFLGGF